MARNHFRAASLNGRPVQAGRLESFEATDLLAGEVRTHIVDVNGTNEASSICSLPAIWVPEVGTRVRLYEPERVATVAETAYLFDANGFSVSVWINDPLTAPEQDATVGGRD